MSEQSEHQQGDQDPAPIEHSDAERVGNEPPESPEEMEDDPAQNPDEKALRDVKGG